MDWKQFFDKLGLNGTHWQWRIMRWQKQRADWKERGSNRAPQVSEKHKFCTQCGALLERGVVMVYYGASDSCICRGSAPLEEIIYTCFESEREF